MPFPLVTERLVIEPLVMSDVEDFVRYRQDPAIARFQGWDTSYSADDGRQLISAQAGVTIPDLGDWVQLAVRNRDSGVLVGDVALHTVRDSPVCFEIGFTVAAEFQGRGFAREAVRRLLDYLFSDCNAQSIRASSDRRNSPSVRLLSDLGFELRPSQGWTEDFKGETVQVDVFEFISADAPPDST